MKRLGALVLAGVLVSGLAACGSQTDTYCGVVKDHRKELNEMVEADTQFGLITHLPMLEQLADASPSDLTDEWQVFLTAVKGLAQAVRATGHQPEDFADGAVPDGISAEQKQAITTAADRLSSPETVTATTGIDQQARDVCKVNLGR